MKSLRWLTFLLVLPFVVSGLPQEPSPPPKTIKIDIRPGSYENPVSLKSQGIVPVAILGSNEFSVSTIDLSTVRFGTNSGAAPLKNQGYFDDVNGDSVLDWVLLFRVQETGIADGAVAACLSGKSFAGEAFYGCDSVSYGLSFPFRNPLDIVEVYCFGIYPWDIVTGETHGGFDIVPKYKDLGPSIKKYEIVASADAVVDRIIQHSSGAGAAAFTVLLKANAYWYVINTFETQSTLDGKVQEENIYVKPGQKVMKGEVIGALVVSKPNLLPWRYPHLHYGFFYKNPNDTVDNVIANYLNILRSDGTNLPHTIGQGSPWEPQDLGIPTTLFCPYVYSSPEARAFYDSYTKRGLYYSYCRCPCAYGSQGGNCGVCKF